MTFSSKVYTYL